MQNPFERRRLTLTRASRRRQKSQSFHCVFDRFTFCLLSRKIQFRGNLSFELTSFAVQTPVRVGSLLHSWNTLIREV